ncbi:MAG: TonB-dependent receptor [Acidobacteria bacterium]|nr:TonB-dependent receptor [Acidobacteriota bacterium]
MPPRRIRRTRRAIVGDPTLDGSSLSAHSAVSAWYVVRALVLPVLIIALWSQTGFAAADQYGRVTFADLPVPGASVTATQGATKRVTVTDQQGVYHFANLDDGVWTIKVEMLGFASASRDVTIPSSAPPPTFALTLRSFSEITAGITPVDVSPPAPPTGTNASAQATPGAGSTPAPAGAQGGFQRAAVSATSGGTAVTGDSGGSDANAADAADGFLINGSVNNGASSPFAQLAAFGNNRRGARALYNGGVGITLGSSAFDTRPFSFTGQPAPKSVYSDAQIVASFAGPVRIPKVFKNAPNLFLGYQHTANHNATAQSALMPSALERSGDFSQSVDATGRAIKIVDPTTGQPFRGGVIPAERISPQAASLLGYYPAPNVDGASRYNYQTPVLLTTHQDAMQSRVTEAIDQKNQLFGNVAFQRTATDNANVFGFVDSNRVSGLDAAINWSHRFSQFFSLRTRYQYTGLATNVTPNFAGLVDIAGAAGIAGTNQDPVNWGPPNLIFSSGVAGFSSAQYASNQDATHGWMAEGQWGRGRHNLTLGGDIKIRRLDVFSQQDARGTFGFNGAATGSDLADFLLGLPHTSAIAFGNANKNFRGISPDAYITDDWRVSPTFTANIGVRWEYESPLTEQLGRLVNLDVAPDFTSAGAVLASNPVGPVGNVTGQRYPDALIRGDTRGFEPRVGVSWRPVPGSSLVIRAGYGVYRNTSVYQSIAMLLAQQPPLSKTLSVESSAKNPLTLANGFSATPNVANTFAVDPDFRVGYAQNWQVLAQRDLPASLTITATYLGTAGSHLMQEFLPNTNPIGAANPCPNCPAGFAYLTSNGASNRQSGQLQLRRRLRNGLTAMIQYTLSKATDDAPAAFTGASLNGASIAQDWRNLGAEQGPSSFDQRHVFTAQFQYTSGAGMGGGALMDGAKGSLLKGWTITTQMTAGSGLPLTPIYLTSVAGTGVTGTIRASETGPSSSMPDGFYANPSAFSAPSPGQWGTAGRNSIRGPAQFSLNGSVGRSFLWGDRFTADWRIDATNVLNRVTYSMVNTIVGSPQFGLPNQANAMRKLQSSLRVRF